METLIITFAEGNGLSMYGMPSFSFIHLIWYLRRRFLNIFPKFPFMSPRQVIKLSNLNKRRMKPGVRKNSNIQNVSAKIANFHFSNYKSMETISCHSNQSSYPTGTKKHNSLFPLHVDAIYVIWKESASWLQRRSPLKMLTDDRRTPDTCIY